MPRHPEQLRSGYTTGACAAAAAKGATQMLTGQTLVNEVTISLPAGFNATFKLQGQSFSANEASCFVIKDAGDDPDVTNGAEVWGTVTLSPHLHADPPLEGEGEILVTGGAGIGKVTKPGLAVPPGEWAINPVPRRMIEESVRAAFSLFTIHDSPFTLHVTISIPDGEERAKKTLNQRLGIIGGLSILGTTGIVRPVSAKAWTDTIDVSVDVARASGSESVVLSTGRTSEMAAEKFFTLHPSPCALTEDAFIMMGDHVAYTLQSCAKRGFTKPIIACQFAKLLKIACGHENTHAAASELDLAILREWGEEAGFSDEMMTIIDKANTAREIVIASGFDPQLIDIVALKAGQTAVTHSPGISARFLLCGYDGTVVWPR